MYSMMLYYAYIYIYMYITYGRCHRATSLLLPLAQRKCCPLGTCNLPLATCRKPKPVPH